MCEKKFYAKMQAEVIMSDYYMGLLIGAVIGYCGAMLTMLVIWSLCVVAKKADGDGYYADETNTQDRLS